jgi:hypothetical protein
MRIHPALKGRNMILVHLLVVPLQGVAILITRSNSQGGALGWNVAAPTGRNSRIATSKEISGAWQAGLQALLEADRNRIQTAEPRNLRGSVNVEQCLERKSLHDPFNLR